MIDRIPPQSREAERGLLGSILRENSVLSEVSESVSMESFYFESHKRMYRHLEVIINSGKSADMVILANALKDHGEIDEIGGYAYIEEVWDSAPTAANSRYYADIIHRKHMARRLILACTAASRDAYEQSDQIEDLVTALHREILSIETGSVQSVNRHIGEIIREVCQEIDRSCRPGAAMTGVATGLKPLDDLLGGLHPGELIILAARPSVGKTALAGNICRNAADAGTASLMFSLEQSRIELGKRWLCGDAMVNSYAIRSGRLNPEQVQRLMVAGVQLGEIPIWVNDTPSQKTRSILSAARRLASQEKLGLIVVDYLQLIQPDDRGQNRNEQIGTMSRELKNVAREINVPVLCLCQLSRAVEQRDDKRPRLSDLRDSGEIEQNADTVIFLHRPLPKADYAPTEQIDATVQKQRNGPCGDVPLLYRKAAMRFEEMGIE